MRVRIKSYLLVLLWLGFVGSVFVLDPFAVLPGMAPQKNLSYGMCGPSFPAIFHDSLEIFLFHYDLLKWPDSQVLSWFSFLLNSHSRCFEG